MKPWLPGSTLADLLARARQILSTRGGDPPTRTNWCVLTGPPSSGKTALATALADQGYQRTIEPVREYFQLQVAQGHSLSELWANPGVTVSPIHLRRFRIEQTLDPDQLVFLDTAVPDTLVYGLLFDTVPSDLVASLRRHQYSRVFILEPLVLEPDPLRGPLAHLRDEILALQECVYSTLGCPLLHVPPLPVDRRARYVLEHVLGEWNPTQPGSAQRGS